MANTLNPPVNNSFVTAARFLPLLDEIYKRRSLTAILDTAVDRVRWDGAQTVNLFKIAVQGLGNYSRNAGFVPGSVDGEWEPFKIQIDRGRSFSVDVMDNDETVGMAFGALLGEFERTQVIPETDAYRFATYASGSGLRASGSIANKNVADLIQTAEAEMDDAEVPYEGRILYVSPTAYKNLKGNITRFTENGDPDVNGNVEMYDDMRVLRVPKARFNTQITLNAPKDATEMGGYTATGSDINFLIIHPSAILQVVKHRIPRIFSPEVNQLSDGWKLDYRIYHDAFVESNKVKGIYLHSVEALSE